MAQIGPKRKGKQMNIEIRLNDGTTLNASFDPSHKGELEVFYTNQKAFRQISGYIMRDNSGKVLKVEI